MKLLTNNGMKCISNINTKDSLLIENGKEIKIIEILPARQRNYLVTMQDGTKFTLTDQIDISYHIARSGSKPKIKKIRELFDHFNLQVQKGPKQDNNIPKPILRLLENVDFKSNRNLLVDPYTLGAVLGDGCITQNTCKITSNDTEIVENIRNKGYDCNLHKSSNNSAASDYCIIGLAKTLKCYNLIGCNSYSKFIPEDYIKSSIENRYALVQGLMDTDGYIDASGKTEFCTISPGLRDGIRTILQSLGFTVTVSEKKTFYRDKAGNKVAGQLAYNLYIRGNNQDKLFRLQRKLERVRNKKHGNRIENMVDLGICDSFKIITDSDLPVLTEGYVPVFLSKGIYE